MNNRNLANKYRPARFEDIIGQDAITEVLKHQVITGDIKTGYLFSGPAGTGKTTTARVMAQALNGNNQGLIELDGASNNGVDHIRAIIEDAHHRPLGYKFKVYVIDEVQMLTTAAFNALLKTLEEPPAHVVFILATTNPERIPLTIHSRLQRFNFQRVDNSTLASHLAFILASEGEERIDAAALDVIIKQAQGGVRDAIQLLDHILSFNKGVAPDVVAEVVGTLTNTEYGELLKIYKQNPLEFVEELEKLHFKGFNVKVIMKDFTEYIMDQFIQHMQGKQVEDPEFLESKGKDTVRAFYELNGHIQDESDPLWLIKGWVISYGG